MLKIKDYLVNEDEVRYIQPFYNCVYGYCIFVEFRNNSFEYIPFNSEEERNKELKKVLKKVEEE